MLYTVDFKHTKISKKCKRRGSRHLNLNAQVNSEDRTCPNLTFLIWGKRCSIPRLLCPRISDHEERLWQQMAAHKLNGWIDNLPQIRILSSALQR